MILKISVRSCGISFYYNLYLYFFLIILTRTDTLVPLGQTSHFAVMDLHIYMTSCGQMSHMEVKRSNYKVISTLIANEITGNVDITCRL